MGASGVAKAATVFGAGGQLGYAVAAVLAERGWRVSALRHEQVDVADLPQVEEALRVARPDLVVNCAGVLRHKFQEREGEGWAVNAYAPAAIGLALERCSLTSVPYVHVGSLMSTRPVDRYSWSKWLGELAVKAAYAEARIVQVEWVYGTEGHNENWVLRVLQRARSGQPVSAVRGRVSPCYTYAFAGAVEALAQLPPGLYAFGPEPVEIREALQTLMGVAGLNVEVGLQEEITDTLHGVSSPVVQCPPLRESLEDYLRRCPDAWRA